MREAADRVLAVLSEHLGSGGPGDPMSRAMQQLEDAVNAVPTDDMRKQRVMTERLRHLHARLDEDPRHEQRLTVVAWRKVTRQVLPVPSADSSSPAAVQSPDLGRPR